MTAQEKSKKKSKSTRCNLAAVSVVERGDGVAANEEVALLEVDAVVALAAAHMVVALLEVDVVVALVAAHTVKALGDGVGR